MTERPMDVPTAVRLINETLDQWAHCVRTDTRLDDPDNRALLRDDWARMTAAMRVITDWSPS